MIRIDDTVKDRAGLGIGVALVVWLICAITWISAMFIAWEFYPMASWVLRLMFVAGFIFGMLAFLFPEFAVDESPNRTSTEQETDNRSDNA